MRGYRKLVSLSLRVLSLSGSSYQSIFKPLNDGGGYMNQDDPDESGMGDYGF